ncbi:MAG: RnfABCDGE type electron transport complex subunit B [Clostridia bacterium]|nr:RnfABCDGE type electron transport complex subunit B [Clostridia bacterium]
MIESIVFPTLILGGMGGLFGLGLAYAAKVLSVNEDERVAKIREALPGANCGGCGFPGCDGFAAAVAEGKAAATGCPVGGDALAEQLSEIMGVACERTERKTARVMCNGRCSVAKEKYSYYGIDDCFAASQVFAGHKACSYGCLGHGTCVKACPFNAIVIVGGVARVIEDRCKSCGKCIAACPKKIIEMVTASKKYAVLCRSKDKGPITKKNCDVGCIGCTKCVKACQFEAISMEGPLARIDTEKCTNCGECVKVCPTMAIRKLDWDD